MVRRMEMRVESVPSRAMPPGPYKVDRWWVHWHTEQRVAALCSKKGGINSTATLMRRPWERHSRVMHHKRATHC